jgi:long-subunit acyl-CoA synthetase (AMP-forming)
MCRDTDQSLQGLVTATMKLNRKAIQNAFSKDIEELLRTTP